MDALAWARFKTGGIAEARDASAQALRTGNARSCHPVSRGRHRRRRGRPAHARTLVARALDRHPTFDVIAAPEAHALQARLRVPLACRSSHASRTSTHRPRLHAGLLLGAWSAREVEAQSARVTRVTATFAPDRTYTIDILVDPESLLAKLEILSGGELSGIVPLDQLPARISALPPGAAREHAGAVR